MAARSEGGSAAHDHAPAQPGGPAPDHAGQNHAGQNPAQDDTGQDHTGQDHTGQDHTGQDHTGQHYAGQDHPGPDHPGKDHPGQQPAAPVKESSLTLERGLNLLQAVADAESEAPTISDLAAAVGVSRAAVYRLLGPLQKRGLIRREGSKVRLGLGVLSLAGRVLPQLRLAALPALRVLAEQVGATVHLTVADGMEAQAIAVVEPSWTNYHVAYRVGTRHAVQRGAAGRAVDLPPGGPRWVTSSGEAQSGAYSVAAPVRGVPGLRASVGVLALEPLAPNDVGPRVAETAQAVARALR